MLVPARSPELSAPILASALRTAVAVQTPPRGVGTPRSVRPRAIPWRLAARPSAAERPQWPPRASCAA